MNDSEGIFKTSQTLIDAQICYKHVQYVNEQIISDHHKL